MFKIFLVLYALVVNMSIMYATQPLQPLLAKEFGVGVSDASYFTAIILFWLGIAPIVYGYILEGVSVKKMLLVSFGVLVLTNTLLGFSFNYEMFFILRFIEALAIPAIVTSCMTILARSDAQNISFNMSLYVSATVLGGLIGRVFSGLIASFISWQSVFFSLSIAGLVAFILVARQNFDYQADLTKGKLKDVLEILANKELYLTYFLIFCMFFVFAGILNVLPFRIKDMLQNASEAYIGFLYIGYGSGIVISLLSKKLSKLLGSEFYNIMLSGTVFCLVIISFLTTNLTLIFILMFFLCLGMFGVHTVCSGIANSVYKDKKALTSGMYLTFYYIGGTLGSVIPAFIYEHSNWQNVILLFAVILAIAYATIFINRKIYLKRT